VHDHDVAIRQEFIEFNGLHARYVITQKWIMSEQLAAEGAKLAGRCAGNATETDESASECA
jgi:hypothetical protein